jgi:hypothetical protein
VSIWPTPSMHDVGFVAALALSAPPVPGSACAWPCGRHVAGLGTCRTALPLPEFFQH